MASLDVMDSLRLVTTARVARLATVTEDGAPHIVPCCFAIQGETLFSVIDGKPKSTSALRRLDNVRANPRVSLIIDHYDDDWTELWWVRIDGIAAVSDDAHRAGVALLQAKYPQYIADVPSGPMLKVDITSVTGWAYDVTTLRVRD